MNRVETADRLAARTGLSKAVARETVDGVFAAIGAALANGEKVRIAAFGTFGTRSRPARTGLNRKGWSWLFACAGRRCAGIGPISDEGPWPAVGRLWPCPSPPRR